MANDADGGMTKGNEGKQGQLRTMGGRPAAKINQTPVSGVINHNPNPGIGDMAAKGKIDIKFAETSVGSRTPNRTQRTDGVTTPVPMIEKPASNITRKTNQTRIMGETKQYPSK